MFAFRSSVTTALFRVLTALLPGILLASPANAAVKIDSGLIEGLPTDAGGVRAFRGIPFAAPPVGELRWKAPQPVQPWEGVRQAVEFGPRPMQGPIYSDMVFRDAGPSEDCLTLNVWTPAKSADEKLAVMVWIYGGGLQAGGTSEPRQDGAILARKGVVVVSMNYRLGLFGFFAHPELKSENNQGATGNYGFMDQIAALQWVQRNIAAFGGDPHNVTVFGESAGSESGQVLICSPLSRGLFHRAIGQSGSFTHPAAVATVKQQARATGEEQATKFATAAGAKSIRELREKPADELLKLALANPEFKAVVDGAVLTEDTNAIFAAGKQADVPLIAGWTRDESRVYEVFGEKRPTLENFRAAVHKRHGENADAVLKLYPATTDAEAVRAAGDLACDRGAIFGMWKWMQLQNERGRAPVYHYIFDRVVPIESGRQINGAPATASDVGAVHASDIGYTFSAFDHAANVPWQPEDRALSNLMMTYWSNFAKTGNPNGPGVPQWPRYKGKTHFAVMHLDVVSHPAPEEHRDRYEFFDAHGTGTR